MSVLLCIKTSWLRIFVLFCHRLCLVLSYVLFVQTPLSPETKEMLLASPSSLWGLGYIFFTVHEASAFSSGLLRVCSV